MSKMSSSEELIRKYFTDGYSYLEIVAFLAIQHKVFMSLSTLKRRLKELSLRRRVPVGSEDRPAIKEEVATIPVINTSDLFTF